MKRKSCHVVGLLLLLGLLSCREPASEPEFQGYVDSADIFVYNVDGDVLKFGAEDCRLGFGELEGIDGPFSLFALACGSNNDLTAYYQSTGHIFSGSQKDKNAASYGSSPPSIHIQNEAWPWTHYTQRESCRHDPESGFSLIGYATFSIDAMDDTKQLPAGFDDGYKVTLIYRQANPMLEEPCIRIEVQGGYFVKY